MNNEHGPSDPIRGTSLPHVAWTRVNAVEAVSGVMSPLCMSFWTQGAPWGAYRAFGDLGVLSRRGTRRVPAHEDRLVGCFYGRMAISVDAMRRLAGTVPGSTPDDFERNIFGTVRPDAPPVHADPLRLPVIIFKASVTMLVHTRRTRRHHACELAWWRAHTRPQAQAPALALLQQTFHHFRQAIRLQMISRGLTDALQTQLARLTERAGRPELLSVIFAGAGDSPESDLGERLWQIARQRGDLAAVLNRYGFHGVDEGNLYGRSWREDPAILDTYASALRDRPADDAPAQRAAKAVTERQNALRELHGLLPRRHRLALRLATRMAAHQIRNLQMTKEAFLMAIDVARAATRRHGTELVEAGVLKDAEDAFHLTLTELVKLADETAPDVREVIAYRKQRHAEYQNLDIPLSFIGMPTPAPHEELAHTDELTGTPASPGITEGTARVLLGTASDTVPQRGEIVVCKVTDPSWTPLLILAAAIVVDIGGIASHGAIIARELGIPCIICPDATRHLHTGDYIRVDGRAGTVQVLQHAPTREQRAGG
ncbi:PEP-utilizing enzyme [Streptomyces sp. GbtcB6]|uniref:PEP-utilizing enzyme n=1 Tax=Streptomyces sp. GbtcB6 TaxID=2824751 RepID=UPI001C3102FE|nr:PEP-utilizing enzyme [Streptomyces sp. GbtcB6]